MGFEAGDNDAFPNFQRIFKEVGTHGHGGLMLFMTDALQEYLQMKKLLKQLPKHMRLTEQEKAWFEGMLKAIKGVKQEFSKQKVVEEVIEAHKDDTDSKSDGEGECILKSIKLWLN